MFFTTSEWIRKPVFAAMRLLHIYRKTRGFFANQADNPACAPFNIKMEKVFMETLPMAVSMVEGYFRWIEDATPLPDSFRRTFSV